VKVLVRGMNGRAEATAEWLTRSSLVSQALARVLGVYVTYIRCGIAISRAEIEEKCSKRGRFVHV